MASRDRGRTGRGSGRASDECYAEAIGGETIDAEGLAAAVANRAERPADGTKPIESLAQ
jgi:hypothetical protein